MDVVVKLVLAPPSDTVAPESTPFTKTLIPVTSTGVAALAAAEVNVMVVDVEATDDCPLALEGVSIRNTEFGLMVTNVAPRVFGEDALLGE